MTFNPSNRPTSRADIPLYDASPPDAKTTIPVTPAGFKKEEKSAKPAPDPKPVKQSGTLGELIKVNELVLFRVMVGTGGALGGLKMVLPDAELLKLLFNHIVLIFGPIALIYFSSQFGWRKGEKIGFFWLFGFSPIASLIVR